MAIACFVDGLFFLCSENKGATQLTCAFVFAYEKVRISHNAASTNTLIKLTKQNEPRHEKTNILHIFENADQLRGDPEYDQRLCFRYLDSTIPLLLNLKFQVTSKLL